MTLPTALDPIRRFAKRLWAVEVFTLVNLIVTIGFLRWNHLRIDWKGFWYIERPLFVSLPYYLAAGAAATLVVRACIDRSFRPMLARLRTVTYYLVWLRLWVVMLLGTYCYAWLKVSVPMVHPVLFDQQLWDLDILLHAGISPSLFLTHLFDGTFLVGWIDAWYSIWVMTVMVTLVFLTAYHSDEDRRLFVTAKVLLWSFGAWIYVAVPALGPVYAFPEAWSQATNVSFPYALSTQMGLWLNYQTIQQGIAQGQLTSFNPVRGIAAMPSLHVGAHVFFALWAWHRLRPLFVVFLLAAVFTFLGSILTGWHYAIDGWVGAGLAGLCFFLARRITGRTSADPATETTTEAMT